MKVFGSLTKVVSLVFQKSSATVTVQPTQTTGAATINIPDLASTTDVAVLEAATQTLSNKTLPDTTTTVGATGALTKALKFLLSGATAGKTMTIASSHTDDRTITLPDSTGTLATLAGTETLTNKKLDGGTASTTNEWIVPSKTSEAGLSTTTANIFYDTTADKLKVYDGSWKVIGGGLIVTPVSHTINGSTLESGKHYLIDMSGASADITVTLPAGATESVVRVTAAGNNTNGYRVTIDGNGSEKIAYNSTQYDDAKIMYADQWAEFSWDSNDSQWLVNDASSPLNGTFSGAITFTGDVSVPTKTPASASASGTAGVITWDSSYIYVCVAANTWKRVAIATW